MKTTPKDPLNCKFGTNLSDVRDKKGISQRALAELVGVTVNYISSVEQGRKGVSVPGLIKIAKVLEVKPSDLLKGL